MTRASPYPGRPKKGDRVAGKYELFRLLGEGGMGTVWLAEHLDLEARVAVKLLRRDVRIAEAEARFRREAKATARVHHPAVVRVFDYGTTLRGEPFIVMELLEGRTLAEILDKCGPLDPVRAVRILLPIVEGLAAVHERGVVHRDLKPENIFLANEGKKTQPKLVDFGIAKIDPWADQKATEIPGIIAGSPWYMSPEQANGAPDVDDRADIWGFCTVLYEAVSGKTPFYDDDHFRVLAQVLQEDVPPLRDAVGGEAALWEILKRGLVRNRDERYSSIRELGEALAQFLLDRGVTEDITGEKIAETWRLAAPRAAPAAPETVSPDPVIEVRFEAETEPPLALREEAAAARRSSEPEIEILLVPKVNKRKLAARLVAASLMTAVFTVGGLALATRLPPNDPWRQAAHRISSRWSAPAAADHASMTGTAFTAEARR